MTDVGAYPSSPSYYGTYDQGGNIWEWNETRTSGPSRVLRGGSWTFNVGLQSSLRDGIGPAFEGNNVGFRVASPLGRWGG